MHMFELVPVQACFEEIDKILKEEHWPEIGHFKDQPIDMDWGKYFEIQALDKLRCFTIRAPLNESFDIAPIIGYAFYIVDFHLHYKTIKVASQDILYVRKPYRGIGRGFIDWCDHQLKKDGVITVTQHIKPYFDWSPMAESLDYEKAELIYARRLD